MYTGKTTIYHRAIKSRNIYIKNIYFYIQIQLAINIL